MNSRVVANNISKQLLNHGFIVHRYNSKTTSSIYLKLDYGVCCGIRIADHNGKKKYHYRFNVFKDYKGDKIIIRDNLVSYFFTFNEIPKLLEQIQIERQNKISKYGLEKYKFYMKKEKRKNALFDRFKKVS